MRTLIATALLACTGCGTVVNLATPLQDKKVYGGVRNDIDLIEKFTEGESVLGSTPGNEVAVMFALAIVVLPFLDLPLSAVGDTLSLPLTRWLDNR